MVTTIEKIDENTQAFLLEKPISVRDALYDEAAEASLSPIARKLFGFPWTEKVKVCRQSIELTKQDWVDWETLLDPLKGLINEHFTMTEGPLEENPELPKEEQTLSSPEAQKVQDFLSTQVNPSLAMHGGWAELKAIDAGQAFVFMGGGCQGCASSAQTLKDGIETALKGEFPFINEVVDVTDHTQGTNPFY